MKIPDSLSPKGRQLMSEPPHMAKPNGPLSSRIVIRSTMSPFSVRKNVRDPEGNGFDCCRTAPPLIFDFNELGSLWNPM